MIASVVAVTIASFIAVTGGLAPQADAATGKPAFSFNGSRAFIVLYREGVDLAPRLRSEVRKGNEVEDRYTSSINGALLELEAEDVNRLREDDRVLAVSPDRPVSIDSQGRSRQATSWGLDRVNQRSLPLDGLAGMLRSGAGVEAYIIDTGIRSSHSDFAGRVNPEGFSAHGSREDCHGHGTHVAGTVAGSRYGVAPGARLTGVKVLDCDGWGWSSDVIAGIDWMIGDHLADAEAGRSRGGAPQAAREPQRIEETPYPGKRGGTMKDPDSKKSAGTRVEQPARTLTSNYGSGSIQNLRASPYDSSHDYRVTATVNQNICSPSGYCGWFPMLTVFPEAMQCTSTGIGGTTAWVGYLQEQPGTQVADDYAYMPGDAPWRFCVYAYSSGGYRLLHETVLSPEDSSDPPPPDEPSPNRPPNDDFADRQTLTSLSTVSGSTVDATAEPGEPGHYNPSAYSSIWYRWTAPADGNLIVTTAGSSFDTTLAAYSGSSLGSLTTLAENDDVDGLRTSRISIPVTSGTTYSFAVDGYAGATGSTRLAGTFTQDGDEPGDPDDPPPPDEPSPNRPPNDNFADRQTLTSLSTVSGSTVDATAEPGEPGHYNPSAYSSIWYRWTAPADGNLIVTTAGSSFDTTLAAYSGSSLGSLTTLAENDDVDGLRTSRISIPVTSGTTYSFAVDGYAGATGSTRLAGTFTQDGDEPGDPDDPTPPDDPGDPMPFRSAVANMSLGSGRDQATNVAVQRAIDAGITVVVAAGNESGDACDHSPASAPNAITVGATNGTDSHSFFSNSGSCVDILAPGEAITSAWHESDSATEVLSGTSMASPHVAGATAQLLSEDPSMTPEEVAQELTATATRDVVSKVDPGTPNLLLHVPAPAEARVGAPEGDVLTSTPRNTANISINGSEAGSFECSLNGTEWQACRPGITRYPGLGLGSHEFRLRGTVDGRPIPEITRSWRYVPAAPVITRGPKRGTSRTALFRFQKMKGLKAQCRLDRGPWRTCGSPKRYRGLKPGRHTFSVRQVSGDLVSPTESRTWEIIESQGPR